jgi:hypothetical protein
MKKVLAGTYLWLFLIAMLLHGAATTVARADVLAMQDIKMLYHQDHVWLFYRCGNGLFYNHEARAERFETERSLNFTFSTAQTMLGAMYCDGHGRPVPAIGAAGVQQFSAVTTLQGVELFSINNGSNNVHHRIYAGQLKSLPDVSMWSSAKILKDNQGLNLSAIDLTTFEYQGSAYVLLRQSARQLLLIGPDQTKRSITLPYESDLSIPMRATVDRSATGNRLLLLWAQQNGEKFYHIGQMELDGNLQTNALTHFALNWFYKTSRASNVNIQSHMSGKIKLYYVEGGERYESELDLKMKLVGTFDPHSGHSMPFNDRSENLDYNVFEVPVSCNPNKGCMLLALSYPTSARFILGGPARLLHPLYAGKVVAKAFPALPATQNKMEVIGIIEGPPPIPSNNLMASLKVVPAAFVQDAARGLSRFIKTNLTQELSFSRLKSKEKILTSIYGFTFSAGAAAITPIQMSLMSSVGKKIGTLDEGEEAINLKETFSNEIQSTTRQGGRVLELLPIGKVIMMKYDIKAIQYVFYNDKGEEVKNGQVLFSLAKTNVRPVIRPYEILGRKLLPAKYPNGIIVGDLDTYSTFQRRHALIEQAGSLAPNHSYLSFTYNNMLDMESNITIAHSHRQRVSNSDLFTLEGGLGGQWQKLVGAQVNFKNEEERTIALQDIRGQATSIHVEMNYVQPTNDTRVRHYDFELYYLLPSQNHLRALVEELQDTSSHSSTNRQLLNEIKLEGAPWKVTYSVSDIRIPYR